MEILKFGIIGFLIFLPFHMLGQIAIEHHQAEKQIVEYLEHHIEEASYDAAFAMKTYSTGVYHSEAVYRIEVDIVAVIDTFKDSIDFRNLPVRFEDFSALIFMTYDGVVIYNPKEEVFMPMFFYVSNEDYKKTKVLDEGDGNDATYEYYNLGDYVTRVDVSTFEKTVRSCTDLTYRDLVILQTLERALESYQQTYEVNRAYDYMISAYGNTMKSQGVTDMSFIPLFESETIISGKSISFFNVAPSGVMKIRQEAYQ